MDDLSPDLILRRLSCRTLGGRLLVLPETDSTMNVAVELADEGAPDGTIVIADHQSAGRGRLDRSWEAPPGAALLMSVLFKPDLPPTDSVKVTMAAALAAADAVERYLPDGLTATLKWPNDVLVNHAKIGGLIAEAAWQVEGASWIVVGVGLNVGQRDADLPPGATSLAALGIEPPMRAHLAADLVNVLDEYYTALRDGNSPREAWAARLSTIGQDVEVSTPQGFVAGHALGVADDGALLLRADDGSVSALHAGDVTLLRTPPVDGPTE